MRVSFLAPDPKLSEYIRFGWIVESRSGIAAGDRRLIVPDGRAKIIIPHGGSVSATVNGETIQVAEHEIALVGLQSSAATIDPEDVDVGTIGLEISAKGLYHLFEQGAQEAAGGITRFEDLFGSWGSRLRERIAEIADPIEKVRLLQHSLQLSLSERDKPHSLLDFAVDAIERSNGTVTIRSLQRQSGYSRRYLDILFRQHVGVPPKTFASIVRFQAAYRIWTRCKESRFSSSDLLDYYYDQPHFIKAFRRFTGFAPSIYRRRPNELGRAFDVGRG